MVSSWLAPSVTICAVTIAALLTYRNNVRLHEAKERLKWINSQLGDFYGPLYSISEAGERAWVQFCTQMKKTDWMSFNLNFTDLERREWIYWMQTVFMPANRRMHEIIVSRSHLLVGDAMPEVFSKFSAHLASYEVIVHKWERGDEAILASAIPFPLGFRESISTTFLNLKRQQQDLLRQVEPRRRKKFQACRRRK